MPLEILILVSVMGPMAEHRRFEIDLKGKVPAIRSSATSWSSFSLPKSSVCKHLYDLCLLILVPIEKGLQVKSWFCDIVLCVLPSLTIMSLRKREQVAFLIVFLFLCVCVLLLVPYIGM